MDADMIYCSSCRNTPTASATPAADTPRPVTCPTSCPEPQTTQEPNQRGNTWETPSRNTRKEQKSYSAKRRNSKRSSSEKQQSVKPKNGHTAHDTPESEHLPRVPHPLGALAVLPTETAPCPTRRTKISELILVLLVGH